MRNLPDWPYPNSILPAYSCPLGADCIRRAIVVNVLSNLWAMHYHVLTVSLRVFCLGWVMSEFLQRFWVPVFYLNHSENQYRIISWWSDAALSWAFLTGCWADVRQYDLWSIYVRWEAFVDVRLFIDAAQFVCIDRVPVQWHIQMRLLCNRLTLIFLAGRFQSTTAYLLFTFEFFYLSSY